MDVFRGRSQLTRLTQPSAAADDAYFSLPLFEYLLRKKGREDAGRGK